MLNGVFSARWCFVWVNLANIPMFIIQSRQYDSKWASLVFYQILSTITVYVTCKTIERVIAERESLKKSNWFQIYALIYLDIGF